MPCMPSSGPAGTGTKEQIPAVLLNHVFCDVSMACEVSAGTTEFHVFGDLTNLYSSLPWDKKRTNPGLLLKEILN